MVGRNFMKHVVKAYSSCSSKMRSIVSSNVGVFSQFSPRASICEFTSGTQNHDNQEDGRITKPYADPYNEYAFKLLFKEPGNEDLLIGFLNSMLRKTGDEEITHVTPVDSVNLYYCVGGTQALLDVYCQDKSGHEYIIQIQKRVLPPRQENLEKDTGGHHRRAFIFVIIQ